MLGGLYWWLLARHDERLDQAIASEVETLQRRLAPLEPGQMAKVIERVTLIRPGGTTVVMVATERFEWLAGNLRRWPGGSPGPALKHRFSLPETSPEAVTQVLPNQTPVSRNSPGLGAGLDAWTALTLRGTAASDPMEFELGTGPTSEMVRARIVTLPGGRRLLVGRNLAAREEFRGLVGRAFLAALGLTVLIGVAGGYILSRRVATRLDQINRESEAILEGALDRRMPGADSGDEFGELSGNLNRMLDRISAVMDAMRAVSDEIAHDLRSPLTRLRGRLDLALLESTGGTSATVPREAVEGAVADVDRVLGLIDEILTIALAESGLPNEGFTEVDLVELARSSCELYEPLAEEAGLTLVPDVEPGAQLRGHRELLARALGNLLDNALKYVPRGGRIRVCGGARADRFELVVEDDGPGIPDAFRSRALERFSRLDPSRSTVGSGLGLSLVRAVATLHAGEIRLEDNAPGLRVVLDFPGRGQLA